MSRISLNWRDSASSPLADFGVKLLSIKILLGLSTADGKGQVKWDEVDIGELIEKSANFVFFTKPFNKIVGDLGVLALHKEMRFFVVE